MNIFFFLKALFVTFVTIFPKNEHYYENSLILNVEKDATNVIVYVLISIDEKQQSN